MSEDHPVQLNGNSYISLALVVLVIGATLWIKDGQAKASGETRNVAGDLASYKEIQMKDKEVQKLTFDMVNVKLDALSALVKGNNSDVMLAKDARNLWKQLKLMNPDLKVPEF